MKKPLLWLVGLLLVVWAIYAQTAGFEFLRFDDHDYTFRCLFVREGLSLANVGAAFTTLTHAAVWMPVTYISYMADISLFGGGPAGHHLVNVFFHSLNVVLLFQLLRMLFREELDRDGTRAYFCIAVATAFWAFHPQRVEAVAWIACRKELLCTFFTFLGLISWLLPLKRSFSSPIPPHSNILHSNILQSNNQTIKQSTNQTFTPFLPAYLFALLACMSKPTAMCFPLLAFSLDWFLRLKSPTSLQSANQPIKQSTNQPIKLYLPLLALALATGALAIYSQTHAEGYAVRDLFSAPLWWRLLNAAVAIGLYFLQLVIPYGIHIDYRAVPGSFPLHGVLGLSAFAIMVLICLVPCLVICLRHRHLILKCSGRMAWTAWIIFIFSALVPTLGIFGSFGEHARADRFLYLPMAGVSALLAMALLALRRVRMRYLVVGCVVLLLGYTGASLPVVAAYSNDYTVFARALKFDPEHGRALAHVASEECARFHRLDHGITLYRKSQQVRPRDDTAAQLAYALALRGLSSDYAEIRQLCARFACDHSLDRKGQALEALGATAMRQRRWKEAISFLEDSIKAPGRFYSADDAWLRLGACYCNAKRPQDAIKVFEVLCGSRRQDIAGRARQFLEAVKRRPDSILFF